MAADSVADAHRMLRDENGQATQRYQDYLTHQEAYRAARRAYDDALAEAQRDPVRLQAWPITGMTFQRSLDEAYQKWLALGSKTEVEAALAVLAEADLPSRPPDVPTGSCTSERHDHNR